MATEPIVYISLFRTNQRSQAAISLSQHLSGQERKIERDRNGS